MEASDSGVRDLSNPDDDTGVGPAPPETVQLWLSLVNRMDLERLESFVARIRREWSTELPPALAAAVATRRAELARGA